MDFLNGRVRPICFKYLTAAFGSALITSIYGIVDMAMVGQYQGPESTAALAAVAPVWNIIYSLGLIFFDWEFLTLFGAEERLLPLAQRYLLPIKFVVPAFLFNRQILKYLGTDALLVYGTLSTSAPLCTAAPTASAKRLSPSSPSILVRRRARASEKP